jgi:hypothetical protein
VFYILAENGLFRCRNTEFFTSCVKAEHGPNSLAQQAPFLRIRYPHLPRHLLESIVGFFSAVYRMHKAEAAVLILWDRLRRRYRLLVPKQESRVFVTSKQDTCPLNVHYETPVKLPANTYIIGDAHSHCDEPAYASWTDRHDETYRTGLHIVVGRIDQEPPEFHVEAVVDGARFRVKRDAFFEGYNRRRRKVPDEWLSMVQIETVAGSHGYSTAYGQDGDTITPHGKEGSTHGQ